MALFKDWQDFADQKSAQPDAQKFWAGYFLREKDFYAELLKSEPISGTVQALAERFGVDIVEMTGFLDGINESLKTALDLESLTAETEVSLDYDPEKLYYNMVAAKAEWLYTLPERKLRRARRAGRRRWFSPPARAPAQGRAVPRASGAYRRKRAFRSVRLCCSLCLSRCCRTARAPPSFRVQDSSYAHRSFIA